jgi:site-specific DNA recombinase
MRIRRRGVETRLIIGEQHSSAKADPALLKAIARARSWWKDLESGAIPSITAIAQRNGVTDGYVGQLLPLAFLAPTVIEAVIAGTIPPDLTVEALVKRTELPLDWAHQRQMLNCG